MMAGIIKLQNIQAKEGLEQVVEEYVCGNCRHLIEPTDAVCWQCGEPLQKSSKVEHYHQGKQLTPEKFKKESGR